MVLPLWQRKKYTNNKHPNFQSYLSNFFSSFLDFQTLSGYNIMNMYFYWRAIMKRLISLLLSAILCIMCLSSCSDKGDDGYYTHTQRDEKGRLSLYLSREAKDGTILEESALKDIYTAACKKADATYALLSKNEDSSGVYEANVSEGLVLDLDEKFIKELERAFELSTLTGGLYQPAGGSLIKLFAENDLPDDAMIKEALSHTGTDKFSIGDNSVKKNDSKALLDLYCYMDARIIETVIEYLKETEVAYGSVTFNGIAGVFGKKPEGEAFKIDISDGTDAGIEGAFNITDGYVAFTSADFGTHIDFSDGIRYNAVSRAAVYSPDAVTAAAVANIAYASGTAPIKSLYENESFSFEAAIWDQDGKITLTEKAESASLYTPETTAPENGND